MKTKTLTLLGLFLTIAMPQAVFADDDDSDQKSLRFALRW